MIISELVTDEEEAGIRETMKSLSLVHPRFAYSSAVCSRLFKNITVRITPRRSRQFERENIFNVSFPSSEPSNFDQLTATGRCRMRDCALSWPHTLSTIVMTIQWIIYAVNHWIHTEKLSAIIKSVGSILPTQHSNGSPRPTTIEPRVSGRFIKQATCEISAAPFCSAFREWIAWKSCKWRLMVLESTPLTCPPT